MRTRTAWRAVGWGGPLAVLCVGALAYPYTVDDAYIVARYAEHLAKGLGYSMNPGAVSDGVTGPLWVLPGAVAVLVGLDPITTAKIVGLGASAAAVALVVGAMGRRRLGSRGALVTGLLAGVQPTLAIWGVAGLETGLATLAFSIAAVETVRPRPRSGWIGCAIATLAWLRPELALAALVLLGREALAHRFVGVVVAGVGAGGIVVFRLAMFGAILPASFHAKPPGIGTGVEYVALGVVVTTGVAGVFLVAHAWRRGRPGDRWLALSLVSHLLAVALAGGDWMPGFRLLAPILPAYALLAGVGAAHASVSNRRALRIAAGVAMIVALAVPVLDLVAQLPAVRAAGEARERGGAAVARLLADRSRVALVDVGYIPYTTGVEVIDLGGLTDSAIGARPGGHLTKEVDEGLLSARAPDAIVLHSESEPTVEGGALVGFRGYPVEQRVAAMSYVRDGFRVRGIIRYAPTYWYVVLVPR